MNSLMPHDPSTVIDAEFTELDVAGLKRRADLLIAFLFGIQVCLIVSVVVTLMRGV